MSSFGGSTTGMGRKFCLLISARRCSGFRLRRNRRLHRWVGGPILSGCDRPRSLGTNRGRGRRWRGRGRRRGHAETRRRGGAEGGAGWLKFLFFCSAFSAAPREIQVPTDGDSSHKDGDSSHKKTLLHIELSETACRRHQRTSECRQAAEAAFPAAKVDLVRIRAYLKAPGADAGDFFDCLKAPLQP